MAPVPVTDDYYAVLGVVMTADTQSIRAAYRRLARVTHPDKNPSPDGKEQFQRLQAAYETLSDPTKRMQYDFTRPKPSAFSHPFAFGTTPQQDYGRPAAETASQEAERAARAQALEKLQTQRARQEIDIFETRRHMRKLEAEIANLQEEDAAEAREAASQTGWWKNVSSFFFGAGSQESKDLKEERERRRLDRNAAIRIKSLALSSKTSTLSALETVAQNTAMAIERLKHQIRMEEQRQEAEREAYVQRQWEEMLRRSREAAREAAREAERQRKKREEEEREQREQQRKEQQRKEWERVEREQEELRRKERERVERVQTELKQAWENSERKRKDKERREQQRNTADANKGTRKQQSRPSRPVDGSQGACLHVGWWNQIPGRTVCSVCSETLGKFALQCPGCQMKACAACRRKIQRGNGNGRRNKN
ncbi:hypothetical protein O1611_g6945 [Lasiodiplodia mahajangana]|uniref:Uncharacterized protein n=1 Tax=Lasiodiplodia mahajangana TaxID=1108764 RepID=A0ACC2JGP9_9PEZI|nr:hypothetical protein O1611_g6945 [Lasiodiplodia mahajangana]